MKLKKLGKYFTKGLQAGVLATALIAGNVSCSQPAGGNDTEFTGGNGGNGGNQQNGWQQPAYMNITEEFGGQRFVESNADWFYDTQNDKNTKFTARYNDANQYIDGKVDELQKLWQETNTGSPLSDQINTALNNFNNGTSINENIENNYGALIPVFATMEETFLSDAQTFHAFNASYHKLAAYAYNQSLGAYKSSIDFQSNKEMRNLKENFFVDELNYAGLSYDELTDTYARTLMNQYLSTIAVNTDTDQALLKKVVELALVNESLYGLNDYANRTSVSNQDFTRERSYDRFYMRINDKINNMTTMNYNQDDRTM